MKLRARHFSLLVAAASWAAACSSGTISLGDDGTNVRAIGLDTITVANHACPAGFAHPTLCCGKDQCFERGAAPFAACSANETAFGDGQRCCALDRWNDCTECSTGECGFKANDTDPQPVPPHSEDGSVGGKGGVLGAKSCGRCPPWMTRLGDDCCPNGGACVSLPDVETCPKSCKLGFSPHASQPDLCCRHGGTECYVWVAGDADDVVCSQMGTLCTCQKKANGRVQQMHCDADLHTCTCTTDSVVGREFGGQAEVCTPGDRGAAALSSAWKACAFPEL